MLVTISVSIGTLTSKEGSTIMFLHGLYKKLTNSTKGSPHR